MEEKIEDLVKNDPGLSKIVSDPEALKSYIMKVQQYLIEARGCDPVAVRQYLEQAAGVVKEDNGTAVEEAHVVNQESTPVEEENKTNDIANQENSGDTGRDEVQEVSQGAESESVSEDNVDEKHEVIADEAQHEDISINNNEVANAEVQMFNVVSDVKENGYANNQWNGNVQQQNIIKPVVNNVQQGNNINQGVNINQQFNNMQQTANPQMMNNMQATNMNPQVANNFQQQANQFKGQPVGQQAYQQGGQQQINNGFVQNNPVQFNNQGFAQNQVQPGVQAIGTQAGNQIQNQVQPMNNINANPNAQQGFMQVGQGANNTSLAQPKKENFLTKLLNKIFKKKSQ